jgi:hypothetical protein
MKEAVWRYLLQGKPLILQSEQSTWVESGFARFLSQGQTCVADEPLVMMAAANQLLQNGYFETTAREGLDTTHPSVAGLNYEVYLAVYLLGAFAGSVSLEDIFQLPGAIAPEWARAKGVKLVTPVPRSGAAKWSQVNWSAPPQVPPTARLGLQADDCPQVVEWFKRPSTTVLFPDNYMGPDLVCFLQLPDGKVICVVLQAKVSTEGLPRSKMTKAVDTTDSKKFYTRVVIYYLLSRYQQSSSYSDDSLLWIQNGHNLEKKL